MKKLLTKKNVLKSLIIFSVLFGIIIRFQFLSTHFSHVDDISPARAILEWKNYSVYSSWISNETHPWAFLFKVLDSINLLKPLSFIVDIKNQALGVALSSTYAPVQFLLTAMLINPNMSYTQLLFWGRLPSFIFGSFSIMVLGYLAFQLTSKNKLGYALLAMVLTSFSLENIIYSVQMESYAIGVFALTILLILFVRRIKAMHINIYDDLVLILVILILSWSQYQFLFFLPGFYLGLLTHGSLQKDKSYIKRTIILAFISLILVLPIYLFMSKSGLLGRGINWNSGVNGEFYYSFIHLETLLDKLFYTLKFFSYNTYLIIKSNFTMGFSFLDNNIFYSLLNILMMFGLYSIFKTNKALFTFVFTTMIVWTGLVVLGILTLSPTRHSLILFPMQLIIMIIGLQTLLAGLSEKKYFNVGYIQLFISIILILSFMGAFQSNYETRKDPFNPEIIEDLLIQYKVDHIVSYGWTWNLDLMDYTRLYQMDIGIYEKLTSSESDIVAFISHRVALDASAFTYMINSLNATTSENYSSNLTDYNLVFSETVLSDVEVDALNLTKNGTNSFYFYIYQIKE